MMNDEENTGPSRGSTALVALASVVMVGAALYIAASSRRPPSWGAESAAMAAMRTYAGAQNIFHRSDYDGDGVLEYCGPTNAEHPDFTWLGKATAGGQAIELIGGAFAAATTPASPKAGYWFVDIPLDADGKPYDAATGYALCAVPAQYNVTGLNTFIIDTQGTVYQRDNGGRLVTRFPDVADPDEPWLVCE